MKWPAASPSLQSSLIWIGVGSTAFLLWYLRQALLVAFGAVLLAILLRSFADLIARLTGFSVRIALTVAVGFVIVIVAALCWFFGSRLAPEFSQLFVLAQRASSQIDQTVQTSEFGGLLSSLKQQGGSILGQGIEFSLSTGGRFLGGAVIVVIGAVYLAIDPRLYRDGLAGMFSTSLQPTAAGALTSVGNALRLWLFGQFILMILVGILTTVAALLIGLPVPFALGSIAGIAEFVPYVGPILAGIPAVLVALTKGLMPAVITVAVYIGIHIFEGYIAGPPIQRRFTEIPPALLLIGIFIADLLFGPIGIIFAGPLTVACFAFVRYVCFGEKTERTVPLLAGGTGAR